MRKLNIEINSSYKEKFVNYKNHIATVLFLLCLAFTVYHTHLIKGYLQESLNEQNKDEVERNILNLNFNEPISLNMELPLWAKCVSSLLNIIYALFLGGILYGKIE